MLGNTGRSKNITSRMAMANSMVCTGPRRASSRGANGATRKTASASLATLRPIKVLLTPCRSRIRLSKGRMKLKPRVAPVMVTMTAKILRW